MQLEEKTPIVRLLMTIAFTVDGTATGQIECGHLPFPVPFCSIADLTGELDRICDYLEFPQAWENRRRLAGGPRDREAARALAQARWESKRAGTPQPPPPCRQQFQIQIYCRQHVSLQGLLTFRKERIAFRSALELQGLLAEVLEAGSTRGGRRTLEKCTLQA